MNYTEDYLQSLEKIRFTEQELHLLRNKSILITGAGGLICSALTDVLIYLNRKNCLNLSIYAAGRSEERISRRFYHWESGRDYNFIAYDAMLPIHFDVCFDYIIHGASNAVPAKYSTEPVETMLSNLEGMNNLLRYIAETGTGRILYISSSEVYGKKKGQEPYSEEEYGFVDILNPRACYPSSKRAAETLCAAYKKEYSVDYVVVRPGHIYGPTATDRDNRASSQFARDVKSGKPIVMKSAGNQLRSYCYVMDCATAILTVLLKGKSGEAYNISNKDSIVTIREMADAFARAGGQTVEFDIPTEEEAASYNLMENSSLTSDKIEQLGWHGKYSMQEGAARTLESL